MRNLIYKILVVSRRFGARALIQYINRIVRKLSSVTHYCQHVIEWAVSPSPENYDHFLDQYWQWGKYGNPLPWERGIFSLLAMEQGAKVLELCCGDGFNAYHFYAVRAGSIKAVDFDADAIRLAKKNFKNAKIEYIFGDIRCDMPHDKFDNIIWDAAIEHFTENEISIIMQGIKERLSEGGVLSGYTIVENSDGKLSHSDHEYEFKSKEDLLRFLSPYFGKVKVFETTYPARHNLYFYASDSQTLPFDVMWDKQITR